VKQYSNVLKYPRWRHPGPLRFRRNFLV